MLRKTVLTFAFLTVLTTFYGFNATFDGSTLNREPAADPSDGGLALFRERECVISPYDPLIRNVSEQAGNDWRLLSAIAYHESRFTPDIVSRRGARGLMQIMPVVARQFNVPADEVLDPETNVWLANQLLNRIDKILRLPAGVPFRDRMSLILASYNGGIGHVTDARRLARQHGENPDSWDVVSRYLRLKAEPEYYQSEVVRNGRFTGSRQTLAYVRDVMGRYDKYCRLAER